MPRSGRGNRLLDEPSPYAMPTIVAMHRRVEDEGVLAAVPATLTKPIKVSP